MNSFGRILRLTTFGESHGPAIGGVLDGIPAGWRLDLAAVQAEADKRRPGVDPLATQRLETDRVEFLSGIHPDGRVLGSPIAFIVRNNGANSADYDALRDIWRPGHADYSYDQKYGLRDHRGGGRSSARETAARVIGGAIAAQWLNLKGVDICARLESVGSACGDEARMRDEIERVKRLGDSVGGVVGVTVTGLPPGIGAPVGDKLQARLAEAMLSINAAKGFEYGDGFAAAAMTGSRHNDPMMTAEDGSVHFMSNHAGGILGGISTGMPVTFRVAFKPTPSIALPLPTTGPDGVNRLHSTHGRHDPCVALRAVHVVRAMTALTLADLMLLAKAEQPDGRL